MLHYITFTNVPQQGQSIDIARPLEIGGRGWGSSVRIKNRKTVIILIPKSNQIE